MALSVGKRFVVAIDGPAAAGKGTIAKALSERFNFCYLDTGLLYRAVASKAIKGKDPIKVAKDFDKSLLSASDIRSADVARMASRVAKIPAVRAALFEFQREFSNQPCGTVLDGRDIGTVIFPDAAVKLFITASSEVRAKRRFEELLNRNKSVTLEAVFKEVKERDERDAMRHASPLQTAYDAIVIDTTGLTIQAAVKAAIELIETALQRIK